MCSVFFCLNLCGVWFNAGITIFKPTSYKFHDRPKYIHIYDQYHFNQICSRYDLLTVCVLCVRLIITHSIEFDCTQPQKRERVRNSRRMNVAFPFCNIFEYLTNISLFNVHEVFVPWSADILAVESKHLNETHWKFQLRNIITRVSAQGANNIFGLGIISIWAWFHSSRHNSVLWSILPLETHKFFFRFCLLFWEVFTNTHRLLP